MKSAGNVEIDVEGTNSLKEDARQERESNISKLESENKLLKVQLEKFQRVLTNMNKELTQLKTRA